MTKQRHVINIFNVLCLVKMFCLLCLCVMTFSGCELSNSKKITFIKNNKQKTDEKIMKKQKNPLIVPEFLKSENLEFDDYTEE